MPEVVENMGKNNQKNELKRREIVKAAMELFFEKGYEETSIRMIQAKVGMKVAGFYYYFGSKDEVFDAAINLFFEDYVKEVQKIVEDGKNNPEGKLTKYLNYIYTATENFREQYIIHLHWSILGAIRESFIKVMRKYIRQILENYINNGSITQGEMDIEVAVNVISYSFGCSIVLHTGEEYRKQKDELEKLIPMLLKVNNNL